MRPEVRTKSNICGGLWPILVLQVLACAYMVCAFTLASPPELTFSASATELAILAYAVAGARLVAFAQFARLSSQYWRTAIWTVILTPILVLWVLALLGFLLGFITWNVVVIAITLTFLVSIAGGLCTVLSGEIAAKLN